MHPVASEVFPPLEQAGTPRRVVLIGRRQLYLDALRRLLESNGSVSVSIESTLETCIGDAGKPDLVVIDCPHHEEAIDALVEAVRHRYPGVSTMLLTSSTGRESAQRARRLRVDGCLSTSWGAADVVGAIMGGQPSRRRFHYEDNRRAGDSELLLSSLSEREHSVLRAIVTGSTIDDTAAHLGISAHTVRTHVQNIMAKLAVRSQAEMVSLAVRAGIPPARRSSNN
jgi:DNA-binding NarL/FixJ family response regulator